MKPHNPQHMQKEEKEFDEKIIQIKRVSKKTKGGNQISFSALVVVGDHKGRAGVGFDKGPDVISGIRKAVRKAKDRLVTVELDKGTIPHEVNLKYKSSRILLKPAPEGTGVIAGGGVRAVVEAFGVKNVVAKRMGTANKAVNVNATFKAMTEFTPDKMKMKQRSYVQREQQK
jgi:small subunit ribosomal protein S5